MATNNIIPSIDARGRFEALAPFDAVVKPEVYYKVEAIRNLHEMEALKLDLYTLVFQPVGVSVDDFPKVLERARSSNAKVLSLLDRTDTATYVLTTYLKSWPLVDGVSYENMCCIISYGAVPPSMKDTLALTMQHYKEYTEANVGIPVTVSLGTIPTIGYVSKDQYDAYENTRKAKITATNNDAARALELERKLSDAQQYIAELEADIIKLGGNPNPGP